MQGTRRTSSRCAALLVAVLPRHTAAGSCLPSAFRPAHAAVAEATPENATALAEAFLHACSTEQLWTSFDTKKYFQMNWHAGAPAGMGCPELSRIGLSGDGGKTVCDLRRLLHAAQPCRVISIGSNGEPSFEKAVHGLAPHCMIDTFDGTLNGTRENLRANLPSYINFIPMNVDGDTWRRYDRPMGRVAGGVIHISLLKMDCEGCEFESLPPFLDNVCVDQILLELHACQMGIGGPRTARRVQQAHQLMMRLDTQYRIFNVEPNIAYGDGTCIEYSFSRRTPCATQQQAGGAPAIPSGGRGWRIGGSVWAGGHRMAHKYEVG